MAYSALRLLNGGKPMEPAALTEPENGSGPGRFTFAHGRHANSTLRILEGLNPPGGAWLSRGRGLVAGAGREAG